MLPAPLVLRLLPAPELLPEPLGPEPLVPDDPLLMLDPLVPELPEVP